MARLRHANTGVTVNVSDDRAALLGAAFVASGSAEAPAPSANKSEWVDHAVANGADRTAAENMTKAELQEQYG